MSEQEYTIDGVKIRIANDEDVDNTGAKRVWDAGLLMTGWLAEGGGKGKKLVEGKKVVELGSGLGLVSSAAGILGATVVSTEMEMMLPLLARNTSRALEFAKGDGKRVGTVHACRLDWTTHAEDIPKLPVAPPYDFIFATDVVYVDDYLNPFLETINALLALSPRAQVYIASEIRDVHVHAKFLDRLSTQVNLKCKTVPKKKLPKEFQDWKHAAIVHGKRPVKGGAGGDDADED